MVEATTKKESKEFAKKVDKFRKFGNIVSLLSKKRMHWGPMFGIPSIKISPTERASNL